MEKGIARTWELVLIAAVPTIAFILWATYIMAPWLFE